MSNIPTIRPATGADLPALLDLYQHLSPGDERPTADAAMTILDRLRHYHGSDIFLMVNEGTPVASCTLLVVPNLTRGGKPYALIENVVTHGDFRRRGYGRQVLAAACSAAWAAGCYKVMLMTGSTDQATLGFYRNSGFEQTKTGFQMRRLPVRES